MYGGQQEEATDAAGMQPQPMYIGSEWSGDHVQQELSTGEQNDLSAILEGTTDKDTPEKLRLEKRIEETEMKAVISPLMPPFYVRRALTMTVYMPRKG